MSVRLLPLALAAFVAGPALAAPAGLADLAAIDAQVAAFAGGTAVPVDRRLRLVACATPLALSWRGARRDTVHVPPNAMVTIALDAGTPGRWMLHCHHMPHLETGMMTEFAVTA